MRPGRTVDEAFPVPATRPKTKQRKPRPVVMAQEPLRIPNLLTRDEVAQILRVDPMTVKRLIDRGELRVYRTRPAGKGGREHVYADSVAEHIARNSYGGER